MQHQRLIDYKLSGTLYAAADLVLEGMVDKEIATVLDISLHAAKMRVHRLLKATGCSTRVQFVIKFLPARVLDRARA